MLPLQGDETAKLSSTQGVAIGLGYKGLSALK